MGGADDFFLEIKPGEKKGKVLNDFKKAAAKAVYVNSISGSELQTLRDFEGRPMGKFLLIHWQASWRIRDVFVKESFKRHVIEGSIYFEGELAGAADGRLLYKGKIIGLVKDVPGKGLRFGKFSKPLSWKEDALKQEKDLKKLLLGLSNK
jgi:hypothetical protein